MNAYILHKVGQLTYEQTNKPAPGPGEVLLQVKAAGICGSDIPRIYSTGAHTHPLIPGHEFSGIVVEAGEQAEAIYREHLPASRSGSKLHPKSLMGKRMGVFPLIPCGHCSQCQSGRYELCRSYSYLGSRRNGGFAEYTAVPAANLIALPDTVSFEEASMLEPMAVAVHAMRKMNLKQKDTIAICGLGTIGLLLLLFLREAGFSNLLAIGNKEIQRKIAMQNDLPKDAYCDSGKQNVREWLLEQTGGQGVSAFFECVGKAETVSLAVDSGAPEGRIMLIGNPHSDIQLEKQVYWKILRNQLTLKGTWNSSFLHNPADDWHYVLEQLKQKRIEPAVLITHRFPLEKLEQGFHIMKNKSEGYGKILGVL